MIAWFRNWLRPPVLAHEDQTRVAGLVYTILLIFLVILIVLTPITWLIAPTETVVVLVACVILGLLVLGLLFLTRRGHARGVGMALTIVLFLVITLASLPYRGVRDPTVIGYCLVIVLAGLLLGGRAVLIAGLGCALAVLGMFYAEISGVLVVHIEPQPSPFYLIALIAVFSLVSLLLRSAARNIDEGFARARRNAQALAESNRELAVSHAALEAHTRDLERRSRYQTASTEVSQVVNTILDPQQLMSSVVDVIRAAFELYYVGLFTLDETGEWAVLRAGTGEAGRAMLARGHRLRVGEGMIGWSVAHAQSRVAPRAEADAVRLAMPELPATRSEAALPLRSRGQVLGALTIQSHQPDAFDEVMIATLQTMADQVAVSLDNARLFAQAQAALEAERRAYGELARAAWAKELRARPRWGYRYTRQKVAPAEGDWPVEMQQAAQLGRDVRWKSPTGTHLALPLKARGRVVGVVNFCKRDVGASWTTEEVNLLAALVDQVGLALESARLYQETQRRAVRERLTSEITARVRETLDIDTVLQTAVQEVRQALGLPEVVIRLVPAASAGPGRPGQEQRP